MDQKNKDKNPDFVPIEVSSLRGMCRDLTFNMYLKLSEDNMTCLFSTSSGLDYKRLAHYAHRGVKELYIQAGDLDAYRKFVSVRPKPSSPIPMLRKKKKSEPCSI
jgi:hypothetical protein